MNIFRSILLTIVAAFSLTCASYSGDALLALSHKNLQAAELTSDMCVDFAEAALLAKEGEDRAYYVLGRAYELRELSRLLSTHADQCFAILSREGDFTKEQLQSVLSAFQRSWRNTKALVR